MLVSDVITRLDATVPTLTGRIQSAADLSKLIAENALPQVTPAAFVLPLGFDASPNARMTGLHSQMLTERIGVVLLVGAAADATGALSLQAVDDLVEQVKVTLVGWAPVAGLDTFDVTRGRLTDLSAGLVFYQLDFSTTRLLRV
jgi:hypothetical protein